jgi:tRNA-splicing ligase RtcB
VQEVFMRGGLPNKSCASSVDESALDQAANVSKLPFVMRHVGLMPDAHGGYGMPIGGVFMADKAVVPYAIGVDIGCGVAFVETDLTVGQLPRETLQRVAEKIDANVPTGFKTHEEPMNERDTFDRIEGALRRGGGASGPTTSALDRVLYYDDEGSVLLRDALYQVGTLGGGNHFIELQADEAGKVYLMLHSGSRSFGKRTCDAAHEGALKLNQKWHSRLPHNELAFLPIETPEFKTYWDRMQVGLAFAEVSRQLMVEQVIRVLLDLTPMRLWTKTIDVHHNYAAWENHFGQNGIVHRKGAVRAREGELVAIPGSMGTASYIARGLGNAESFNTCQHGAGRARSRNATRAMTTLADMEAQLGDVVLATFNREDVIDETPLAYKDIEEVMVNSADLVEPVLKLRPLAVVKGSDAQKRKR